LADSKTGKQIGQKKLGRSMFGSPIVVDGKIIVVEIPGRYYVLKPTEKGVDVVSSSTASGRRSVRLTGLFQWSHFHSIDRSVVLRWQGRYLHCSIEVAPFGPETPAANDQKIAQILLTPM
jgi:hypothetical protein